MRCMIALFTTFKPNTSLIPMVPSSVHLRGSEVPLFSFEMRRWKTMGGTVILSLLNTPVTTLLRAWQVLRWWQMILLQSVVVTRFNWTLQLLRCYSNVTGYLCQNYMASQISQSPYATHRCWQTENSYWPNCVPAIQPRTKFDPEQLSQIDRIDIHYNNNN